MYSIYSVNPCGQPDDIRRHVVAPLRIEVFEQRIRFSASSVRSASSCHGTTPLPSPLHRRGDTPATAGIPWDGFTEYLDAPVTDMETRMKKSHREGLASHPDPESCGGARKGATEALTGAHAGEVLSREIRLSGVPTQLCWTEGNTRRGGMASPGGTPRGRRPSTCMESPYTGTGRSHGLPALMARWNVSGRPEVASR